MIASTALMILPAGSAVTAGPSRVAEPKRGARERRVAAQPTRGNFFVANRNVGELVEFEQQQ